VPEPMPVLMRMVMLERMPVLGPALVQWPPENSQLCSHPYQRCWKQVSCMLRLAGAITKCSIPGTLRASFDFSSNQNCSCK